MKWIQNGERIIRLKMRMNMIGNKNKKLKIDTEIFLKIKTVIVSLRSFVKLYCGTSNKSHSWSIGGRVEIELFMGPTHFEGA